MNSRHPPTPANRPGQAAPSTQGLKPARRRGSRRHGPRERPKINRDRIVQVTGYHLYYRAVDMQNALAQFGSCELYLTRESDNSAVLVFSDPKGAAAAIRVGTIWWKGVVLTVKAYEPWRIRNLGLGRFRPQPQAMQPPPIRQQR